MPAFGCQGRKQSKRVREETRLNSTDGPTEREILLTSPNGKFKLCHLTRPASFNVSQALLMLTRLTAFGVRSRRWFQAAVVYKGDQRYGPFSLFLSGQHTVVDSPLPYLNSNRRTENMRQIKSRMLGMALTVFAIIALTSLTAHADPVVIVQPSSAVVGVNQTFSLNISISNVSNLFAYQFSLRFDPTVLSTNSISEGSFLAGGGGTFFIPGTINNAAGTITLTANTLLGPVSGVSGSGVLATFNFSSLGVGSSPITIFDVTLLDSNLNPIATSVQGGNVTVNSVPEPASLLLLGTGLLGVATGGHKRCRHGAGDKCGGKT
jgi:Cohesin domain/PEP-CTERM motif